MKQSLRRLDTVGRKGGDEFVVILDDIDDVQYASVVGQKLVELISQPIEFQGQTIHVGASIGGAILPDQGDRSENILQLADQAMYKVKGSGKNSFALYVAEHES